MTVVVAGVKTVPEIQADSSSKAFKTPGEINSAVIIRNIPRNVQRIRNPGNSKYLNHRKCTIRFIKSKIMATKRRIARNKENSRAKSDLNDTTTNIPVAKAIIDSIR